MLKSKKDIEKRINQLNAEIIMGNYYDGWTLNGLKEELIILKNELDKIIKTKK